MNPGAAQPQDYAWSFVGTVIYGVRDSKLITTLLVGVY